MARISDTHVIIPALWIALFTFSTGLIISLGLESIIEAASDIYLSLVVLGMVILLGIVFDAIGTAAAAADMVPFNAMASRKVGGANQAVAIVRNADLVANLTADVVGDISGTLSGAIGASIVIMLSGYLSWTDTILAGAVMTSLIAALTVGGKTVGKRFAIKNANPIIFKVAQILYWLEDRIGKKLLD